MSSPHLWDRAGALPVPAGNRPRPQLVALSSAEPSLEELFTFMRDAELRFSTLRMRIEERTWTARGEHLVVMDTVLRHPGWAKVTSSEPGRGPAGSYEIWISDGETVRTYSAPKKLGTERPVRHTVRGLEDPDFPGRAKVYYPLTPLPMETLPDVFVHPAGFLQNVVATGSCRISGTGVVAGREAVFVECDHPRATELHFDRPDFHVQLAVDRDTGVILRQVETVGGEITRLAEVVDFGPDASLPPTAFDFRFPPEARMLF